MKLLTQLRRWIGSILPPCSVDYINGSDTLPPPLTKEEEDAVFSRLQQGDTAARELLITHNLRLVVYVFRKFETSGSCLEELISIGTHMFLRKASQYRGEISIDEPLNVDWDGNELLLSDILGTDEDVVNRGIEWESEREMLRAAVRSLPEREREIMEMRFGLYGGREQTQKEVAEKIGISQSYISRLEKKIIKKLRLVLEQQV